MASRVICTEKLCKTGVTEENHDKLLAFIREKISLVSLFLNKYAYSLFTF